MDALEYESLQEKASQIVEFIQRGRQNDALQRIRSSNLAVLNTPNKAGWYIMHFAASCGYTDVIQELIARGINVVCWDNIGQTPLHKAASIGKIDTMLVLLANGAVVYTVDWKGHLPIEMAIEKRHVQAVEVLLMCGSETKLQNWEWTQKEEMDKEERLIFDLLAEYCHQAAGYQYGGIRIQVNRIKTNSTTEMKDVEVTVDLKGKKNNFFLLLRRLQAEYTDMQNCLLDEEFFFGDVIDFRTWRFHQEEIDFEILIRDTPGPTEDVVFVSEGDVTGKVNGLEISDDNKNSVVSVTVNPATSGTTRFAIVRVLKKQIISVSANKLTIVPEMEPGAVIDIPEGTFSSPGEMCLNVIHTDIEEDTDNEEPQNAIVLSNAMFISMNNKSQPKKKITMTLPVHDTAIGQDYVVLTTSKKEPEKTSDWSILSVKPSNSSKEVVFSISHFSVDINSVASFIKCHNEVEDIYNFLKGNYCVVDKSYSLEIASSAIMDKINKVKKMSFAVLSAPADEAWPVVVVCGSIRKLKSAIKTWEKKGYDMQGEISDTFTAAEGQIFFVKLDGNVREVAGEEDIKLTFQNNANYMAFQLRAVNPELQMAGSVYLLEEFYTEILEPGTFCIGSTRTIKKMRTLTTFKIVAPNPLEDEEKSDGQKESDAEQFQQEEEEGSEAQDDEDILDTTSAKDVSSVKSLPDASVEDDGLDQSTIPALSWRSFRALVEDFTCDDARFLGTQLGISQESLQDLVVDSRGDIAAKQMLVKWRKARPHRADIFTLVKALKACGMHGRADKVLHAFYNGTFIDPK